jgi:hypothetical protein
MLLFLNPNQTIWGMELCLCHKRGANFAGTTIGNRGSGTTYEEFPEGHLRTFSAVAEGSERLPCLRRGNTSERFPSLGLFRAKLKAFHL